MTQTLSKDWDLVEISQSTLLPIYDAALDDTELDAKTLRRPRLSPLPPVPIPPRPRRDPDDDLTRPRAVAWKPQRPRALPVVAGALTGVACFVVLCVVANALAQGESTVGNGALVVTVADDAGRTLSQPRVFVDGTARCDSSPCRVLDLEDGIHFVSVSAPGYVTSAARVIRTTRDEPLTLHLQLGPVRF